MKMKMTTERFDPASFYDRDSRIYWKDGKAYRLIYEPYFPHYQRLVSSGLYNVLVEKRLLIPHQVVESTPFKTLGEVAIVLEPEQLTYISYPSEWCFAQLKDAALITLTVFKQAITMQMALKDAKANNVQFFKGKPLFIDTASLVKLAEGKPWIAYRQFFEQFAGPLLLHQYGKLLVHECFRLYPEGIPLERLYVLLPKKAFLKWQVFTGVYLAVKLNETKQATAPTKNEQRFDKNYYTQLIESLTSLIKSLGNTTSAKSGNWSAYYEHFVSDQYLQEKSEAINAILEGWVTKADLRTFLDLGCNEGYFSNLLADKGLQVIAVDNDPEVVGKLYTQQKQVGRENLFVCILDLSYPTPNHGWANEAYRSFFDRFQADGILALALVHHLVITYGIRLIDFFRLMHRTAPYLIVEWIPPTDDKVAFLLRNRENMFPDYTLTDFENGFNQFFNMDQRIELQHSGRIIFNGKRK